MVAGAIVVGGPGAVFWMWFLALVGTATKYAESLLAVHYREVDELGEHVGGPMYFIRNGLGKNWAWMGWLFAFFGALAGFGIGNGVQANAMAEALNQSFGVPPLLTGIVVASITLVVLIGGISVTVKRPVSGKGALAAATEKPLIKVILKPARSTNLTDRASKQHGIMTHVSFFSCRRRRSAELF